VNGTEIDVAAGKIIAKYADHFDENLKREVMSFKNEFLKELKDNDDRTASGVREESCFTFTQNDVIPRKHRPTINQSINQSINEKILGGLSSGTTARSTVSPTYDQGFRYTP